MWRGVKEKGLEYYISGKIESFYQDPYLLLLS